MYTISIRSDPQQILFLVFHDTKHTKARLQGDLRCHGIDKISFTEEDKDPSAMRHDINDRSVFLSHSCQISQLLFYSRSQIILIQNLLLIYQIKGLSFNRSIRDRLRMDFAVCIIHPEILFREIRFEGS